MLLRFGVENHRSIKNYQEISLVAAKLKDDESSLFSVGEDSALRVSPVLAFYGANASGKSTALHALYFFIDAISSSHTSKMPIGRTPYQPFLLDEEFAEKPSKYDADFIVGEHRYHYGFILDGKRILEEWLFSYPLTGDRQARSVLFHRKSTDENEFYFGKNLKGANKAISRLVRSNSLYISAAAQNAHAQLTPIYQFFDEKITRRLGDLYDHLLPGQILAYFSEDSSRLQRALGYLAEADTGIISVEFEKVPLDQKELKFIGDFEQLLQDVTEDEEFALPVWKEKAQVKFMHRGFNGKSYPIDIDKESSGTKSFLGLIGPVLVRLMDGGVIVVDELNSTLHPLLSRRLIQLFQDPSINVGKAQLLFTTHDTSLLSAGGLRRDQIWFAEKNNEGATYLYAMSELKVRSRDNLESGYLHGRFGAVPYYGVWRDQEKLFDMEG
jgi:AAA15 family ATPase/GTPase